MRDLFSEIFTVILILMARLIFKFMTSYILSQPLMTRPILTRHVVI